MSEFLHHFLRRQSAPSCLTAQPAGATLPLIGSRFNCPGGGGARRGRGRGRLSADVLYVRPSPSAEPGGGRGGAESSQLSILTGPDGEIIIIVIMVLGSWGHGVTGSQAAWWSLELLLCGGALTTELSRDTHCSSPLLHHPSSGS